MADDSPAYHLDIAGVEPPDPAEQGGIRPWVGILFECCGVYARVYRTRDGTMYRGRCPQCLRQVRLRIGPDGIDVRLFRAC